MAAQKKKPDPKAKAGAEEEVEVKGGSKKLIIIILGALLLVGGSVGVTVMLLGGDKAPVEEVVDPGPSKGDAVYIELKPFTVNLDPADSVGFLQVQIQILTYYSAVAQELETHKPLISNNLTTLFGQQKSQDLRSQEGKAELQKKVKETIQQIVDKYGSGGEIDNIFFTNFVMQ